jgi:hypothetical protein
MRIDSLQALWRGNGNVVEANPDNLSILSMRSVYPCILLPLPRS